MAREYSCKDCGAKGFTSAWDVRRHKIDKHGAPARGKAERKARTPREARSGGDEKRPRRKYTRREKPDPAVADGPVVDAEAELLAGVINLFANAGTDRDADFRVLEYVAQRFGPAAYEGEEET